MLMTAMECHKYTINLNITYIIYSDGDFGGGDSKDGIHGGVTYDYIDDNDEKVNGDLTMKVIIIIIIIIIITEALNIFIFLYQEFDRYIGVDNPRNNRLV
jgi:ABC-type cobalt transport system substrate-binding protein